ncbi:MAG TPA: M48 family metallopeptidase [Terriglobia bacterium]|nr:M48 family metallopeptidase [Terriglobia bacterium]
MRKHRGVPLILTFMMVLASVSAGASDKKKDVDSIGNRRVAHRSIISEQKEIAIGKQYATEIDRSARIIKDPVINEYVNRVAQNVARNSDLKIPLTVKVIDSPDINAFALPGGFLYVNSGLLQAATEEDQVAGVVAHEIAHVAARHWASQMTKATILQYAMLPLIFTPMSVGVYYGVMEAYMNGVPLAFLKFSRNDEAEADYLGIQYMYKAGYDPNAYVAFFGKIVQEQRRDPGSVPTIFADHPPTAERIIKAEQEIKSILPSRNEYLVSTSEFNDMKARLEGVMSMRRKMEKAEGGPTLEKRQPDNKTSPTAQPGGQQNPDDEKPPVLKRRD